MRKISEPQSKNLENSDTLKYLQFYLKTISFLRSKYMSRTAHIYIHHSLNIYAYYYMSEFILGTLLSVLNLGQPDMESQQV